MNTIAQIFLRTGRISGPEVADGAKPDVPTTDVENENKKKHRVFYEAVDAHARRRLISGPEVADGAKPDVPTTDRQNEKKQEIFKQFQATTVTNRFNIILLSLPH